MGKSTRANLTFAGAALLLLALLPAGYYAFLAAHVAPDACAADAAAREPGAGPLAPAPELRIAEVDGAVEVSRARGVVVPAEAGLLLGQYDTIRTADGRVRLVSPEAYEVQIEPGTVFEIGALQPRLANLRLGLGMVLAKVQPGAGTRLEVAATNSDAHASTRDGAFSMSNNGSGTVAVGARQGAVEFSAAGKAVLLRAGEQSIARAGSAPEAPSAIPSSVFLKVDWPTREGAINTRKVTVTGRTTPGAIVILGGQAIRVDADGRFSAPVMLREGRNTIDAESVDIANNHAHSQTDLVVDTTAPQSHISTKNIWNN